MRVLVDSNIWRYIVDGGQLSYVRSRARRSRHRVLAVPAVLYEAYRCEDRGLRRELVAAITDPLWDRLMPDAFSESTELLNEATRLRPYWFRVHTNPVQNRRLQFDWRRRRGGVWDRARFDPDAEAQRAISPAC